jgi:hypothetical protein
MDKDIQYVTAIDEALGQLRSAIKQAQQFGLTVLVTPTRNVAVGQDGVPVYVDPEKLTIRTARDYQQYDVRGNVI